MPPPYNQIQMHATGVILGKKINMHGEQNHATQHRLAKAKQIWGVTRKNYSGAVTFQKNSAYNYGMR